MATKSEFSAVTARGRGATRIHGIQPAGPIASVIVTPRTARFEFHPHYVTRDGFTLNIEMGTDALIGLLQMVNDEHRLLSAPKEKDGE